MSYKSGVWNFYDNGIVGLQKSKLHSGVNTLKYISNIKMELLLTEIIQVNQKKINEIDNLIKSIYRLIIYSREHLDDDLLNTYLDGMHNLKELLVIKNAQMEAQSEEEAEEYLKNLKLSLNYVVEELVSNTNFDKELQLFQILRLVSPETNAIHPNRYRQSVVPIGSYICPEPNIVPQLISELFFRLKLFRNPIIKAIYFHHELVRIHPFIDGNGRVARLAKNWMLMYDLYPPIFINDEHQKTEYIRGLENSFKELMNHPNKWNVYTELFFEQELDRILINASLLYESINQIGINRKLKGNSLG